MGAVTIATNMAGRGVDIKLGGSPEGMASRELRNKGLTPDSDGYEEALSAEVERLEADCKLEAEKVREIGGLFICGTERHESRRIDNQLRGRAGRQGDPGETRFFLSAEDDLIRLFAGERIYKILDRLGPVDESGKEEALEAKMLSKTIEGAQKKVEQQNFLIRKRVLEYDDVMNEQRRVVYRYRREILEGRDMSESSREELVETVGRLVDTYTPGDDLAEWDIPELQTQAQLLWTSEVVLSDSPESTDREALRDRLSADALATYDRREQELGGELMRELERAVLLQVIDNRWREHLYEMDYLREGIHLRGFAQMDPLVAYKNEGFKMFEELMAGIWEEFVRTIFHVEVEVAPQATTELKPAAPAAVQYSGGTVEQPSALADAAAASQLGAATEADLAAVVAEEPAVAGVGPGTQGTVVKGEHADVGRNDPCWCGSGKKFKKCHGA
jgi:preprotein translocase subunit SecA